MNFSGTFPLALIPFLVKKEERMIHPHLDPLPSRERKPARNGS
jgi:hypothetical protein